MHLYILLYLTTYSEVDECLWRIWNFIINENDFNVVILLQCLIRKGFIAKYACTYKELVLVS